MKRFVARVCEIYGSFKWPIALIFAALIFIQVYSLAGSYYVGRAIDCLSLKSFSLFCSFAVSFLIVSIARITVQWSKDDFELNTIDFVVKRKIAEKTLDKVMTLSVGQLRSEHSGLTHSIINRGENALSTLAFTFVYEICPIFCSILLAGFALFHLSWQLCMIVVIESAFFIFISWLINRNYWGEIKDIEIGSNDNERFRNEILRNVVLVILSAVSSPLVKGYVNSVQVTNDKAVRLYIKYHVYNFVRNASVVISQFFVILVGGYYGCLGTMTPGSLVTFIMWSQTIFGNISNLGALHKRCIDMAASVNKYFQIMDVVPAVFDASNAIELDSLSGRIEVKNLSFKYPQTRYVDTGDEKDKKEVATGDVNQGALCGVNLVIEAGEKVALVGPSGAGKSTLVSLLTRGYDPDEGQILIDGHDLKTLNLNRYRSHIGLVEQNVGLFDNTLRYNIAFGLLGTSRVLTDDVLSEVARAACIDKFYDRLTEGFDTRVGENGVQLSGGERQRVAIARALVKNPAILILDEPTASLDAENEALIKESIDRVTKGRTTIVVAHRFSTIRDADKIVVLEKGRVVGVGRHADLIKTCPIYQKLLQTQMLL
ncbi:MAG: ABC transporter ATP-binding protein [Candidatus Vogelbacteria bacterium]|nr:ABC transporter ATP-binding protein [Candidatus Vogelbacteria bacterium]